MSEYVLHGINSKTFNPYYKTLWRVRHEVDNWMGHKFTNYYKLLVTMLLTGLEDPAPRIRVWTQKIVLNGHHTLQLFDVSWLCQWVCNFYPRNRTICSCKWAALWMVFHIFHATSFTYPYPPFPFLSYLILLLCILLFMTTYISLFFILPFSQPQRNLKLWSEVFKFYKFKMWCYGNF